MMKMEHIAPIKLDVPQVAAIIPLMYVPVLHTHTHTHTLSTYTEVFRLLVKMKIGKCKVTYIN